MKFREVLLTGLNARYPLTVAGRVAVGACEAGGAGDTLADAVAHVAGGGGGEAVHHEAGAVPHLNTVHYSTVQFNTVQYSTVQFLTAMSSSPTQHSRSWLMQATELTIPSRTLGTVPAHTRGETSSYNIIIILMLGI